MLATLARSIASAAVLLALVASPVAAGAGTLVFHASASGYQTLDEGEGGGNPFASALVEALGAPLLLSELPALLQRLTAAKSQGFQAADVPRSVPGSFALVPARSGERRIALVMVVADYAASGGAQSLPGARQDADRIAAALQRAGFHTEKVLDPALAAMLAEFRELSRQADAAVIYTTGHGVEVGGTVFLLPGDYPVAERGAALSGKALSLPEIAGGLGARHANLVFYGGCRDNPFE